MKNIKHLFYISFLFFAASNVVNAKDWRGITPLRSTFADAERLLGKSTLGRRNIYETEEGNVFFFPTEVCGKDGAIYNVPPGTIGSIQIELKKKPLLADLNLDMNKFRKYATCFGAVGYSNEEEGFSVLVSNETVFTLYYQPTADDRKQFACVKPNE